VIRVLSVLVLAAVVLNGMAMRVCAISMLAMGTNCHEVPQPINCEGHSDRSCVCEKPSSSAQRPDISDLELPAIAPSAPLPILLPVAVRHIVSDSDFIPDGAPPVSFCMPLLF
jgi:hypothetical protein